MLPFPTAVISTAFRAGDHADQATAMITYAGVSIAGILLWHLLTRRLERAPQLLHTAGDLAAIRRERRSQLTALAPPVIGIPLALASPIAALLLQAATPAVYLGTLAASRRPEAR